MKKNLISTFITLGILNYSFAFSSFNNHTNKDDGKINVIMNTEDKDKKKKEDASRDENFIYVKHKKDLVGYALQLASFSSLASAKEFALSVVNQNKVEKKQLFIYTMNIDEKTFYKVYFGLSKTDDSIRNRQHYFLAKGYHPFVREFKQ